MGRKKEAFTVPAQPSKDPKRHNAPWPCKWWERTTDENGTHEKRRVNWFETEKKAREFGKEKESVWLHANFHRLTDLEQAEYIHFKTECEERGLSTKEVFYTGLKHFNIDKFKDITLDDCIECFAIWMESEQYSPKTVKGSINNCKWLKNRTDPERHMSSFNAGELIASAQQRYPTHHSNQVSYLKELRGLFRYAAEQSNCSPTIWRTAFLPDAGKKTSVRSRDAKKAEDRKPRFTVPQIKTAFDSLDKRYHPLLALGIIAGLRPESELMNIEWEFQENGHVYGIDFDERTIHLHKTWVSKMYEARRITDLPDLFWDILERVPEKERTGRVSPCIYRNMRDSVYSPIKKKLGWSRWPTDVMRHTALSFQNVLLDQAITMNNAGHTDPKTFYRHYNNAVSGKELKAFLALDI